MRGGGIESSTTVSTPAQAGFVGIGTGGFYPAQFDDFIILEGIHSTIITCAEMIDKTI